MSIGPSKWILHDTPLTLEAPFVRWSYIGHPVYFFFDPKKGMQMPREKPFGAPLRRTHQIKGMALDPEG